MTTLPTIIAAPDQWITWEPLFAQLAAYPLDTANVRTWLEDWSDLTAALREALNTINRAHDENTADPEAEALYKRFVGEIWPRAETAQQALRSKLLALEGYLPQADEVEFLKRLRTTAAMYTDENVALEAEIDMLGSEYGKTVGGLKIEWEGAGQTLPQAALLLQTTDRPTREAAWRAVHESWRTVNPQLDTLYLDLLALRRKVAKNAGFASYQDYVWQEKHRFDYTPEQIASLRAAIVTEWKPLAADLLMRRQTELGLDLLKPWDLEVDTSGEPPLRPFASIDDLIQKTNVMLDHVLPEFGDQFARMIPNFLDLEARPNKAPGGYEAFFPVTGSPYIFMNAAGTYNDIVVLLHEAGHAVHALASHNQQRLIWNIGAPMEFSEVGSMAMELLAYPYYEAKDGGFYSTPEMAARAKNEHLQKIVLFLPYMAVVDEFQEWVYTQALESATAGDLDHVWGTLWRKYMPVTDWTGLEEIRDTGWHRKLHIFGLPFYYIEYGLAELGALQIWRNAMIDQEAAVARYKSALALGKTRNVVDLFSAAGATFPTEAALLRELAGMLREKLGL